MAFSATMVPGGADFLQQQLDLFFSHHSISYLQWISDVGLSRQGGKELKILAKISKLNISIYVVIIGGNELGAFFLSETNGIMTTTKVLVSKALSIQHRWVSFSLLRQNELVYTINCTQSYLLLLSFFIYFISRRHKRSAAGFNFPSKDFSIMYFTF